MGRREQALDAAIQVLGNHGPRTLTHRAVDTAGDLPEGTTSNYFRSRDQLIGGILEHVRARENERYAVVAASPTPRDAAGIAEDAVAMLHFLRTEGRDLALARHALFLEAANRPELGPALREGATQWHALTAERLRLAGSVTPETHARALLACLDGLLIATLAYSQQPDNTTEAIHSLVHAMLPAQQASAPR
ncbi:TetR family transcriptional regulator [Tamaricihabitans halophyticus]|uniref:TetR family transcriptional regulator n=1 Tax=Tamaricihabitans halophyticus TaxID=1262583 RepID=A0A4R2R243_9PSEU|nr:TetR/AcrR family transcriptional regulator [Tamaricihabitans halophyticus]TCP53541.1 TetR family transcriptional regulator [Tamaricihabitans halophyticus]